MTDEPKEGQPGTEPSTDVVTDNPPEPDARWANKTAEELIAIIKEQDSQVGTQASELGQLRTRNTDLEQDLAFQKTMGNPQEQQVPNPFQTPVGNVNPEPTSAPVQSNYPVDEYGSLTVEGVRKAARDEMMAMSKEMEQWNNQISQAIMQAKPTLDRARQESPAIFSGVDLNEVTQMVQGYIAKGIPINLYDSTTFKDAALLVKARKSNYDFSSPPKANPETPPFSETPAGSTTPEPTKRPIVYDDPEKVGKLLEGFKLTKEQADEITRKYEKEG